MPGQTERSNALLNCNRRWSICGQQRTMLHCSATAFLLSCLERFSQYSQFIFPTAVILLVSLARVSNASRVNMFSAGSQTSPVLVWLQSLRLGLWRFKQRYPDFLFQMGSRSAVYAVAAVSSLPCCVLSFQSVFLVRHVPCVHCLGVSLMNPRCTDFVVLSYVFQFHL